MKTSLLCEITVKWSSSLSEPGMDHTGQGESLVQRPLTRTGLPQVRGVGRVNPCRYRTLNSFFSKIIALQWRQRAPPEGSRPDCRTITFPKAAPEYGRERGSQSTRSASPPSITKLPHCNLYCATLTERRSLLEDRLLSKFADALYSLFSTYTWVWQQSRNQSRYTFVDRHKKPE